MYAIHVYSNITKKTASKYSEDGTIFIGMTTMTSRSPVQTYLTLIALTLEGPNHTATNKKGFGK